MTTFAGASQPPETSPGRRMLNKVPEITLYFWVIKILCTTVGETASDYHGRPGSAPAIIGNPQSVQE